MVRPSNASSNRSGNSPITTVLILVAGTYKFYSRSVRPFAQSFAVHILPQAPTSLAGTRRTHYSPGQRSSNTRRISLSPLDARSSEHVARYSGRGWKAQDAAWPEDKVAKRAIQQDRRVGDRFTWTIELPTKGITPLPRTPDFVLEYSHFGLYEEVDDQTSLKYYNVHASPLGAPILEHQFTHGACQEELVTSRRRSWRSYVLERITKLTMLELSLLQPGEQPSNYADVLQYWRYLVKCSEYRPKPSMADFSKPDRWAYRDEEIPAWYHAWEAEHARD
ncbi:MAG: hypothetical protein Q9208_004913 [Pyrenodesmia sp. 3 TL-2023]